MSMDVLNKIKGSVHSPQVEREKNKKEFISKMQDHLSKRGYRADLRLLAKSADAEGSFPLAVKYNPHLGHPDDSDLMSIVSRAFPKHAIDWDTIMVDSETGTISINVEPATEVIPIKSISEIPAEFKSIGTGLFKRKADATGNVNEIWALERGDSGYSLRRKHDDMEVLAEENELHAGKIVMTPEGHPGKIMRFDEMGNAIVLVGNKKQVINASELQEYDIDKEKKKLVDYYTEVYGPEFAKALVEDYSE